MAMVMAMVTMMLVVMTTVMVMATAMAITMPPRAQSWWRHIGYLIDPKLRENTAVPCSETSDRPMTYTESYFSLMSHINVQVSAQYHRACNPAISAECEAVPGIERAVC